MLGYAMCHSPMASPAVTYGIYSLNMGQLSNSFRNPYIVGEVTYLPDTFSFIQYIYRRQGLNLSQDANIDDI